jgi:hypothetical protein
MGEWRAPCHDLVDEHPERVYVRGDPVVPRRSSGAIHGHEPLLGVWARDPGVITVANPKSASRGLRSPSRSTLLAFRSRCTTEPCGTAPRCRAESAAPTPRSDHLLGRAELQVVEAAVLQLEGVGEAHFTVDLRRGKTVEFDDRGEIESPELVTLIDFRQCETLDAPVPVKGDDRVGTLPDL